MKLWKVFEHRPLGPRDRKVATYIYVVMAPDEDAAVQLTKTERADDIWDRSTWDAREIEGRTVSAGLYMSLPTDEEKRARDERLKERQAKKTTGRG